MRTVWFQSPEEFERAAREFLLRDAVMNQLVLGVVESARVSPGRYAEGIRMLAAFDGAGAPAGAVIQTPPHAPLISMMSEDAAFALGSAFAREFPGEGRVFGEERAGGAFLRGYAGGRVEREHHSGVFVLHEVNECGRARGGMRVADPSDAPLLQRWMEEFYAEAMPGEPPADARAGERLAASGRCFIWENEHFEPVCFAHNGRRLGGYWSVGPVYTPHARRGEGFATSLVERWSLHALASGARGCTLLTDLANPVSNRIYERIGYARVGTLARLRCS